MLTEGQIGYFAGFFDGEGWLSIVPRKSARRGVTYHYHTLMAGAGQCDPRPIELLKKTFGGSISCSKIKCNTHGVANGNAFFSWQVHSKNAAAFLETIRPYLIHKQEQCDIALSWRRYSSQRPRYGCEPAPKEYSEIDKEYAALIRRAREETKVKA